MDWCWSWSSNTLATWWEEPTHWKRPGCWERLKAKGEGGGREWDDQIESPTQWTWIWIDTRKQWRTGKPGVLQSMGLQRVRHSLVTEPEEEIFCTVSCGSHYPHVTVNSGVPVNTSLRAQLAKNQPAPQETLVWFLGQEDPLIGIGYPLQYSWASLVAQLERIHLQCGRPGFNPWVEKIPWKRERLPTSVFWPGEFHGL